MCINVAIVRPPPILCVKQEALPPSARPCDAERVKDREHTVAPTVMKARAGRRQENIPHREVLHEVFSASSWPFLVR